MHAIAQVGKICLDKPRGLVPVEDTPASIGACAHVVE